MNTSVYTRIQTERAASDSYINRRKLYTNTDTIEYRPSANHVISILLLYNLVTLLSKLLSVNVTVNNIR